MVLERRKVREFKKRQISQENNNEGDSKVEFTLDKMQAMEKMHMKACGNDDDTVVDDPQFKGNITIVTLYTHLNMLWPSSVWCQQFFFPF